MVKAWKFSFYANEIRSKDIHFLPITIVPRITPGSALGDDPRAACHEVDDNCHRLGRVSYAMIAVD